MNRREFIKSLGLVAGGSAAAVIPALPKKEELPPIEPVQFDKATLQRYTDGRWWLEFESVKLFSPSGKNELVVEIGELKFLLRNLEKIEHTWELDNRLSKYYVHFISGNGWEEIKPQS